MGPANPKAVPIEDNLDLHAFAPSDVALVVEDYVHEAAKAGLRQVRIIHGKGKGVQREVVRQALARHPRVTRFCDAPPEAGHWGATLAWLRTD
jgi:DNA-nicking Smr family endonuclease